MTARIDAPRGVVSNARAEALAHGRAVGRVAERVPRAAPVALAVAPGLAERFAHAPAARAILAVVSQHGNRGTTGDAYDCDRSNPDHTSCHLDGPHCVNWGCDSWPCPTLMTIDRELHR